MKAKVNKVRIQIEEGDLLSQTSDAIVNSTTPNLNLPAAWHSVVGDQLLEDLYLLGYCEVGSATITIAGDLPYQTIIHVVGPRWGDKSARGKLANATWNTLQLAEDNEQISLRIPPISVGENGYPIENCARTMLQEIIDFTFEPLKHLRHITTCTTTDIETQSFQQELSEQLHKLKQSGEGKVSV